MRGQIRGNIRRAILVSAIRGRSPGYAPTVRELAEEINAAPSTVHRHLRILAAQGLIEFQPGVSRTIRIAR